MSKTYGIISEMHSIDPRILEIVINILKQEEADSLILNGDISGERSGIKTADYLATVLDIAGRSNLETYVLPGSHEQVQEFEPILSFFSKKYSNLINILQNPRIEFSDHHLVFLPGSDFRAGDALDKGYSLEVQNKAGLYKDDKENYFRVINMNGLEKFVSDPGKTILFSHIPRKFDGLESCVDVAEFGEVTQQFELDKDIINKGTILPIQMAYQLKQQDHPITLKKENRGNKSLKEIYEKLGIKKNITGHFHDSAGRANDSKGNPIEEFLFVDELFYNASYMDNLKAGIITIADNKITYENINIKNYIKAKNGDLCKITIAS